MQKLLRVGLRSVSFCNFRTPSLSLTTSLGRYSSTQDSQTFEEAITTRRQQANRSIIVQVNSEKSFPELYNYCSQFGQIEGCHHYAVLNDEFHYILIEFRDEDVANVAMDSSCYNEDISGVPIRSPFVWFRAAKKKLVPAKNADTSTALKIVDALRSISNSELDDLLIVANNLEDQIHIVYRATCLNDVGIRLRFLAARQIESAIVGMFPNAMALPFGSSVNGFGKMGCDLDLILRFDKDRPKIVSDSRLVFHTKETLSNGRSQTQRQMECLGDILQLFLPGICHVRRILQARIPIIKFHQEHLDLEIDLSMSNLTGVYMSELLYMFGQIDDRVRPIIFCLRRWAQTCGLTNPSPGRWITNFSLTCLVIFFLQQLKQPILPPINIFTKSARPCDMRITEDGINCTFLRNTKDLQFDAKNESSLGDLLLQFFEFYSQFDFNNRAISLNEGRNIIKRDHSAMYIENPLEPVLNVSKNISLEECERFRIEVRNAAWILESEIERNSSSVARNFNGKQTMSSWGLLNLFRTAEKALIRPNMFYKPRMVDVSDLFENGTEDRRIEFRNDAVRSQVRGIRTQMKTDLKQMRSDNGIKERGGRRR